MPRRKTLVLDFNGALAHLQDEQLALSLAELGALSNATKLNVAAFAKTWARLSVERRRRAAHMLVELAEDNFELDFNLLFRHMLTDDEPQVRALGIEGLWEDEDIVLIKPLIAFLQSDLDGTVRAAATEALGRFILLGEYGRLSTVHTQLITTVLLDITRSDLEELPVRCRAVEALAYWSDDRVTDVITTAYTDDEPDMRASAVAAMGRSADKRWRKIVLRELGSPEPRMRFEAARAAGELEHQAATPQLIALLDDPDREVQIAAITALGQVGGKVAKDALTRAADSDDEVLSELAGESLQELDFLNNSELMLFDTELEDDDELEVWSDDAESEMLDEEE